MMFYEERCIDGVWYWRGTPDGEWNEFTLTDLRTKLAAETKRADDAEAEVPGWVKSFEVYHDAEMRARKLWQEAHNEPTVWPDKARMTIWLLERAQAAEAQRGRLAELLRECVPSVLVHRSKGADIAKYAASSSGKDPKISKAIFDELVAPLDELHTRIDAALAEMEGK